MWSLAVIVRSFLDLFQNYMAFWPLASSFSDELDLDVNMGKDQTDWDVNT